MNEEPTFARAAARQVRRTRTAVLVILGPLCLVVALGAVTFSALAVRSRAAVDGLIGLTLGIASLLLTRVAVREAKRRRHVRIVPYFDRPIGAGAAYFKGKGLASHLAWLDALAGRAGVEPLSNFGFADDHAGETVRWRQAEDLLGTLSAVLEESERPADVPGYRSADVHADVEAIRSELRLLRDDVQIAATQEVRVALLVLPSVVAGPTVQGGRRGYFR